MAKVKTAYFCQNCGHQSPKWLGRCPSCSEWNTLVEEVIEKEDKKGPLAQWKSVSLAAKPKAITEIKYEEEPRIVTIDAELNRVLGGGIVLGSLVLIGGEPGIGKSTLMLQIALTLTQRVLYVSGEESETQIKGTQPRGKCPQRHRASPRLRPENLWRKIPMPCRRPSDRYMPIGSLRIS